MKRAFVFLLALVLCCSILPRMPMEAEAITWIRERPDVDGRDFTQSSKLAEKLNSIFDGNASVYANKGCTKLVDTHIGNYAVPNDGVTMYVGPYGGPAINSGTSCWIYANGVYYTLFGECTASGTAGKNSEKLSLGTTTNKKATYENFKAWGVREGVGALIRAEGHSMIVMGYDENTLTILDGNAYQYKSEESKGLISLRIRSWDEISFTVTYIIQPKEEYYNSLYPITEQGYLGKCTSYPSHCAVKTTKTTYIKSLPCSESTDANSKNVETASKGSQYKAIGLYENTAGNLWYKVTAKNGSVGYLYAGDTTFVSFDTSDLVCPGVTVPTNHTAGKSYVLTGKVSSTYNQLKEVTVSVLDKNGDSVTGYTDTANGNSYTLKGSAIDSKTKFGSLSVGTYTFVVKVKYRSYYARSATTAVLYQKSENVYSATFNVVSASCTHSYSYKATKKPTTSAAGTLTGTCSKCSGTKTVTLPKLTTSDYTYKVTKAATCTAAGTGRYTWKTTTYGTFYFDVSVAAKGHSYSNATCTKPKTCSTCGATSGSAAGHSYNSGVVTKAATCTAEGVKTYTCTVCKATKTEKIAATGHMVWSSATCTKPKTCSACGATSGSALGHSYNNGVITKPATCKNAGTKTYTCTKCGSTKTETIAKLTTHTYDNSCDTGCNVCGKTRTVPHQYGTSWYTDGSNHWHVCDLCGNIKDKAAHTPGTAATESTAQTCTVCDYVIAAALGHTHKFQTEMTGDREGHWYACEGCEEKKDHADHVWKNACDTACDVCGYTREVTHQIGQQWCKDDTTHWHECEVCSMTDAVETHVPGMEATANTAQTCVVCGYEIAPSLGTTETTPPATQPTTQPTTQPSVENTVPTEVDKNKEQETGNENPTWIPLLLIVVAVTSISTTVTVIVLKRKR